MKRALEAELIEWKASPNRKPLLIRGAGQVSKSYFPKPSGTSTSSINLVELT